MDKLPEETSTEKENPPTTETKDDERTPTLDVATARPTPKADANETTTDPKDDDDDDKKADSDDEDLFAMNDKWRCACEGGFLPPGMLKTFGSAEAMMRLGTGQCYHKQM
jgi:hypothetical protein